MNKVNHNLLTLLVILKPAQKAAFFSWTTNHYLIKSPPNFLTK